MSRILMSLAAAAALGLGLFGTSVDAQSRYTPSRYAPSRYSENRYSSGRNFYNSYNTQDYRDSDSMWFAPGYGGYYFYPKSQYSFPRPSEGGYAKNAWRYGLYKSNSGQGGSNIVK